MNAASLVIVAVAVWVLPSPRWWLFRVVDPPTRDARPRGHPRWLGVGKEVDDPFVLAATLDLLAVCLLAGLPVAAAAAVAAQSAPQSLRIPLESAAELLELGSDPDVAWGQVDTMRRTRRVRGPGSAAARVGDAGVSDGGLVGGADCFNELASLARRSARAGSALADGVLELAEGVRRRAHDTALARAERAGVMISGPLGLCFLPAFVCVGIVPVVLGLATQTLGGL